MVQALNVENVVKVGFVFVVFSMVEGGVKLRVYSL